MRCPGLLEKVLGFVVIWEHSERRSWQIANWELETPTLDHPEAVGGKESCKRAT